MHVDRLRVLTPHGERHGPLDLDLRAGSGERRLAVSYAGLRVEVLGAVLRFAELGRRVGEPASIFPGPVALADSLGPLPPAVFVVGTCMHAGKTAAACALVRGATRLGRRVGVAKVTGVALRRDVLEMVDEGAVCAATFADVGYPSTVDVDVVPR